MVVGLEERIMDGAVMAAAMKAVESMNITPLNATPAAATPAQPAPLEQHLQEKHGMDVLTPEQTAIYLAGEEEYKNYGNDIYQNTRAMVDKYTEYARQNGPVRLSGAKDIQFRYEISNVIKYQDRSVEVASTEAVTFLPDGSMAIQIKNRSTPPLSLAPDGSLSTPEGQAAFDERFPENGTSVLIVNANGEQHLVNNTSLEQVTRMAESRPVEQIDTLKAAVVQARESVAAAQNAQDTAPTQPAPATRGGALHR